MKILERLLKKLSPNPVDDRREFYKQRCSELTDELNNIRANFNFVSDSRSIDALIYAENSVTCQLEVLLKEAKAEGISIQLHERMK